MSGSPLIIAFSLLLCILQSKLATKVSSIMGGFFTKALNGITGTKKIKIIMVGLDASGKTTIFYKLKMGDVNYGYRSPYTPETVEYKNITFISWDLDGRDKLRPIWRHYYKGINGIIFVVDSNDPQRLSDHISFDNAKINLLTFGYIRECFSKSNIPNIMPSPLYAMIFEYGRSISDDYSEYTAKSELDLLLSENELKGVPLIVFANKQDLPNALSVNEVTNRLKLNRILQRDRIWQIQSLCATTGDGLYEGLDWMSNAIQKK